MRRIAALLLSAGLSIALSGCAPSTEAARLTGPKSSAKITIMEVSPTVVVARDFVGSYSQHIPASARLMALARSQYATAQHVVGIYPEDPEAVGMDKAHWSLGVVIQTAKPGEAAISLDAAKRAYAAPPTPYSLRVLEGGESAVVQTTLGKSPVDGLAILAWLPSSGYVQVAPTRMEYLGSSGLMTDPVRIVVPVRKRAGQVAKLLNDSATR